MKKLFVTFLFLVIAGSLLAQPMHYNATTGSGNTFPLGQTAGKFVNYLFPPSVFNQPTPCPPGQEITKIYVRMYGTGTRTYTKLHILMAQTTLTNLTTGQFYAGPWDTVFIKDTSLTSPGANTWMPIQLHTPYAYDPTKALVVGIGQCGGTGSGMYVLQTTLTGTKRTWSVGGCPFVPYSGGDARNLCMGIDVQSAGPPPDPEYYNYNNGTSVNSFPFNTNNKMIQALVGPGEFNQPTGAINGFITHIYFRMSTYPLGPATYSGFNIRMKQTTITTLPTSLVDPGDTVYHRASVTLTAAADTWLAFTLDTPFEYDSTKSVVIQIQNCGIKGTFSGFSLRHTTTTGLYRRTYSATAPCPQGYSGRSTYVPNIGINVDIPSGGITPVSNIADKFSLSQNYPNPFNPTTSINFSIPKTGLVTLKVYDILGKEIATLVNEVKNTGSYTVEFNGSNLPSGTYFYRLEASDNLDVKKMVLIK